MMRVQNGNYQAVCLLLVVCFSVVISVCFQFVVEMWVWLELPCMVAEIGNGMADLLAAHFNSGLVAAKLGGGERPVCGNPGTGALWRDLGFVAQRYVVKVLRYHRITICFLLQRNTMGAQLGSAFHSLLDLNFYAFCCAGDALDVNRYIIIFRFIFNFHNYRCLLISKDNG